MEMWAKGIWRRKLLMIGLVLISVSLAFITLSLIPPQYRAHAAVLIAHDDDINSEIEVLRSAGFAAALIQDLHLMADPVFNPRFALPFGEQTFKDTALFEAELARLSLQAWKADLEAVSQNVRAAMQIKPVKNARVISIYFHGGDAKQAAVIVNKMADLYTAQNQNKDAIESRNALYDKRDARHENLMQKKKDAEDALAAFRTKKEAQLPSGEMEETLTRLSQRLKKAQAQYDAAKDKEASARAPKKTQNSSEIRKLKRQEKNILAEIEKLSKRYGAKHPKMLSRQKALRSARRRLANEQSSAALSSSRSADIARARVRNLQRMVGSMQKETAQTLKALNDLKALEETLRTVDEDIARFNESVALEDAALTPLFEAKIISYAAVPERAFYPDKELVLTRAALWSFVAGLCLAALLSFFDQRIYSAAQLEKITPYRCFGVIPSPRHGRDKGLNNDYDEALRRLCKKLLSRSQALLGDEVLAGRSLAKAPQKQGQVVGVTAAQGDARRAEFSLDLARVSAASGGRALVIDADFYDARLHEVRGAVNEYSLAEYLTGDTDLEDVIQSDSVAALYMIYGRNMPHSARDLMSGARLETLIAALRQAYDVIIMIMPVCGADQNVEKLADLCDRVVYGATYNKTPRRDVHNSVRDLDHLDQDKVATVLYGAV